MAISEKNAASDVNAPKKAIVGEVSAGVLGFLPVY